MARQREAIVRAIAARPASSIVYPPLDWAAAAAACGKDEVGGGSAGGGEAASDYFLQDLARIPGLRASGWRVETLAVSRCDTDLVAMAQPLLSFTDQLIAHDDSWPFREPVDLTVVPDYVSVISEPIGEAPLLCPPTHVRECVQPRGWGLPLARHLHHALAPPPLPPLDLSKLRTQAFEVHYRSLEHFLADVNRIFDNCRAYK